MNPAPETYEEMLRLFANLRGAMAERIHRDGALGPSGFLLLSRLAEAPRRGSELGGLLGLDQSTVSRQVKGLCEAGLVGRAADPEDGRAYRIALTDKGRDLLRDERLRRLHVIAEALEPLSPAQRTDLASLLDTINATLEDRGGRIGSDERLRQPPGRPGRRRGCRSRR